MIVFLWPMVLALIPFIRYGTCVWYTYFRGVNLKNNTMRYEILQHTNKERLEQVVLSYLNDGFQLQGGVAVAVNSEDNDPVFFQAVFKNID